MTESTKPEARKRPELLLGALALFGAAVALVVLGIKGAAPAEPATDPFDEYALANSFEDPTAGATQAAGPTAVGSIAGGAPRAIDPIAGGEVVYYTDAAGSVVAASQNPTAGATQADIPTAGGGTAPPQYPVNLNTATQAQLETVPGIGPVKAQAILAWRIANGRFTDPAQLMEIKGIGEKTLQKLLPYVTI